MVAIARKPQPRLAPLAAWLRQVAAIDVRGLAFLRIGFAAILLWDLAVRATALKEHYTDGGLLPRDARLGLAWDYNEPWWMSLHMLSGETWWQAALFAIAAMAAMLLLVGYQTRWMTALCWLFLLSLHGRNPLLLQGGDVLLRCLLFWSIFVPLGACWSVDAWRAARRAMPRAQFATEVASVGTAAIIVQLAGMYLFTALLKTAPSWRSDFSAVYYALSGDHYTAPLGQELLRYPRLLAALTAGSLGLEFAGPLLLFAPIGQRSMRTMIPLAMIGFHLGLALTMTLGTFPWICIVAWAALLPPGVWNQLGGPFAPREAFKAGSKATANGFVAMLLVLVLLLNFKRLHDPQATITPAALDNLVQAAGLRQHWNMFSPGPAECGGWLRIEGETNGGELVNLYQPDLPLPDKRPELVSAMYPTQHWRRSIVTLWEYADPPYRQSVLHYFVQRWNTAHPPSQQVTAARIVRVIQPTPPPGCSGRLPAVRSVLAVWPGTIASPPAN